MPADVQVRPLIDAQPPTAGAATSVAAFIGRTPRGPVNQATTVLSFADYQRSFGGLDEHSPVSYQVSAFFNNGGSQAEIVRLYRGPETGAARLELRNSDTLTLPDMVVPAGQTGVATVTVTSPVGATPPIMYSSASTVDAAALASQLAVEINALAPELVTVTADAKRLRISYRTAAAISVTVTGVDGPIVPDPNSSPPLLELSVANPGAWGREVIAFVDTTSVTEADLFNLTVVDAGVTRTTREHFTSVTLAGDGPNRLDRVLENHSKLVRLTNTAYLGRPAPPAGAWARGQGGVDSAPLQVSDYSGDAAALTGLYAFNQKPRGFNIMSIPPDDSSDPNGGDTSPAVYQEAAQICADNGAMLIIDPPTQWYELFEQGDVEGIRLDALGDYTVAQARASAVYFPRVIIADPLHDGLPRVVAPSGYIAAVWASVDLASGVWKAPAGLGAPIGGIIELQAKLNDTQNGELNPRGINALRSFNGAGNVVWGARTLRGDDQLADDFKYIPVQRTLNYISSSLLMDTRWAAFEPNDPALWTKLTDQITTFMTGLFSQGAFAGTSASQAFYVRCDSTTTTPADQAAGIVNALVGFAPTHPAEFIVITISQQTMSSS